jgi:hypothetical protein
MATLKGAVSVVMVIVALWLGSQINEPSVMALPVSLRLFIGLMMCCLIAFGGLLFISSALSEGE